MSLAEPMNFPENPKLLEPRRAVASLVAMREGAIAPAGDAALVETDFAKLGYSGLDVLRQLLAAPTDLPIVVTFGKVAGDEHGPVAGISTVVRTPESLGEFRTAVRRMRNAGDRMYLSVGV